MVLLQRNHLFVTDPEILFSPIPTHSERCVHLSSPTNQCRIVLGSFPDVNVAT
jgi:hypothetical protein